MSASKLEVNAEIMKMNKEFNGWREKILPNGIDFEGFYENGECIHGSEIYPNERGHFNGKYQNGRRHGKGVEILDGNSYDGDYREGKRHGYGVERSREQGVYKGHFEKGLRHGFGTQRDAKGKDVHSGEYRYGKPLIVLTFVSRPLLTSPTFSCLPGGDSHQKGQPIQTPKLRN